LRAYRLHSLPARGGERKRRSQNRHGVVVMLGRFHPTESGFILEGEVRETALGNDAACSVSGAELDEDWHPLSRSLFDALRQFQGRKVRITLEVVEHQPVDTLSELLERFRMDVEAASEDTWPDF
jgi:hypothetical protein